MPQAGTKRVEFPRLPSGESADGPVGPQDWDQPTCPPVSVPMPSGDGTEVELDGVECSIDDLDAEDDDGEETPDSPVADPEDCRSKTANSADCNGPSKAPSAVTVKSKTRKVVSVMTFGSHMGHVKSRFPTSLASRFDEDEEHVDIRERSWLKKWWRGEERCCTGDTVAHWFYIVVFLLYLIAFPFFLKWMIAAPVPQEFWNKKYDKFPFLEDWTFVQHKVGTNYDISISAIPTTWSGCNHSCSKYNGALRTTSEMNFEVDVQLEAPHFQHTAYPVVLASNDFEKWYVAADKRHSVPQEYFASDTTEQGYAYRHVTDKCTRPPKIAPVGEGPAMRIVEHYASAPTYLMVCVTWNWEKVEWHRNNTNMTMADVGTYCDALGGTCGWPCGSSPSDNLNWPGCEAGKLLVRQDQVAGVDVSGASFSGEVSVRPCLTEPGRKSCTTSAESMSRWPCHKCHNQTNENFTLIYDSLPQMEILLQKVQLSDMLQAIEPHAYVLSSFLSADGRGPQAAETGGAWEKLYEFDIYPRPYPEDEPPEELQEDETTPPPVYDLDRHSMRLTERNKVTMEPSWCFGRRGPLYLVACAVNSSTYEGEYFKEFAANQLVAPPPFNDRCLTVAGRCAYACMQNQPALKYCDDQGRIPQHLLDGRDKKVESRKNDSFAVHMFVWTLLFGFAVKMLAFLPGLFTPYRRAKYYTTAQTEKLKCIAVATPSGGETKACVLRNLIGSISTRPKGCACSFHVLFVDEGHRHPHKIMFRTLVSIVKRIPDTCLSPYNPWNPVAGCKADNLKTFMQQWVEDTKKFRLEECNVDKMVKKIQCLDRESDERKKVEAKIDALCGLAALQKLQEKKGWPVSEEDGPVSLLKDAILQMRRELVVGEKKWDPESPHLKDARGRGAPKPMHLDDCEEQRWTSPDGEVLLHLHYVARAKPDEDERTIKVKHVARGIWCYKLPKDNAKRNSKKWLDWRKNAKVYNYGKNPPTKYLVPLRTSRGKAGGMNFAENYLFEFCTEQEDARNNMNPLRFKYSLFSIADARHQFQPDFFHVTVPYFFVMDNLKTDAILNTRVAFTQCPQYFQEMPDDSDYLDTNNSNFFRLGCMLRNCCGGVSSCGTGGTWLIRDRRAGQHGTDCVWDLDEEVEMEQGFTQVVERQFFHESCKVEDTASSLDRVVKGKYSQYINLRLSYGMAKEATDYLAAVQRWAEGGVVLSLQTFLGKDQGVHMIWAAFFLWITFVVSLAFLVYGKGTEQILAILFRLFTGDDTIMNFLKDAVSTCLAITSGTLANEWREDYHIMLFDLLLWLVALLLIISVVWIITLVSWYLHNFTCCGRRKLLRRTRFPTSLAQWTRLFITVDNLTYFLWFWTAFYWVGFNYYSAFSKKDFNFDPQGMMVMSWVLQILSWSLIIASCFRYRIGQSMASNEVFFLTLTNIWRTTQMFYITAPLTLFSIVMGTSDFLRNRTFGEDISYWVGGDRGAAAKNIVQWWTLMLVLGVPVTWSCFISGVLEEGNNAFPSVLVVTFIGLDAIHPCAYLWLSPEREPVKGLEEAPTNPGLFSQLAWAMKRLCQKLCSPAWHRNKARQVVFSSITSTLIKWVGPVQHVLFPALSIFFPQLGVNAVLNILAGLGR